MIGDKSLSRRDFRRVADPLSKFGASFDLHKNYNLPLVIKGSKKLVGKPIKKDKKKGKSTLIKIMGFKKSLMYAEKMKKKILIKLEKRGKNAKYLRETIEFILGRNF